jgi:hypothetical protein
MTHPDLVTMVLHGFLVQDASDLLMLCSLVLVPVLIAVSRRP